jgi:hypothetical protein
MKPLPALPSWQMIETTVSRGKTVRLWWGKRESAVSALKVFDGSHFKSCVHPKDKAGKAATAIQGTKDGGGKCHQIDPVVASIKRAKMGERMSSKRWAQFPHLFWCKILRHSSKKKFSDKTIKNK